MLNKSEVGDILIKLNCSFFDLWLMAHKDDNQTLIDVLWLLAEKEQRLSMFDGDDEELSLENNDLHNQLRAANKAIISNREEIEQLKSILDKKNANIERLKGKLSIFIGDSEVEEI